MRNSTFEVQTVDGKTGVEKWIRVSAPNADEAKRRVVEAGMLVGETRPLTSSSDEHSVGSKPKQHGNRKLLIALIVVGVLAVLGTIVDLFDPEGASAPAARQRTQSIPSPSRTSTASQEWYEGGTLHRSLMSEWRAAPYPNRLATAGDFVSNVMIARGERPSSMSDLKERAIRLEICISEAGRDGIADSQQVSEIAAACMILMGDG